MANRVTKVTCPKCKSEEVLYVEYRYVRNLYSKVEIVECDDSEHMTAGTYLRASGGGDQEPAESPANLDGEKLECQKCNFQWEVPTVDDILLEN
jgi:DNA-directed RNA polymerase subunit M/transcription elongation factor TFIIS